MYSMGPMRRAVLFGVGMIAGFGVTQAFGEAGEGVLPATDMPTAYGSITGEVRFPSCNGMAPGLRVCASSLSEDIEVCTSEFITDDDHLLRYALELPVGRYVVYAATPVVRDGRYRAYYSEAVRCGMHERCDDHTPTPVAVMEAVTTTNVHPADWTAGLKVDAIPLRL